jgi:membrane protein
MRPAVRATLDLLQEIQRRCARHAIGTESAALAFYTLFLLAPILLVVGSIAGRVLGSGGVHDQVVRQLQSLMGADAGLRVATALEKAARVGIGAGAGALIAGVVAFIVGVTATFVQLQAALDQVWEVAAPRTRGQSVRFLVESRLVSFLLVLLIGFLLVASLALSAGLVALTVALTAHAPFAVALATLGNEVLSFSVFTVLVALIYRTLPDAKLAWRDVATGAIVTSILFSVGKWLIALYLARSAVASRFGAAGTWVVILLWVYYTSYIVLFGAELTAVHSGRNRRHRK